MRIGILTDSTSYLPPGVAARAGIEVVPLSVVLGHDTYVEGVDHPEGELGRAYGRAGAITTSRPSPSAILRRYERMAEAGCEAIVSIHLSAALSGTYDAALLAAPVSPVPVQVVDSQTIGLGLGFAVLDAYALAQTGATPEEVADWARLRASQGTVLFCVASLEWLRRGGRIGAASALLGSALGVKPILGLVEGHIEPVEKQRTMGRAVSRLGELAAAAALETAALVEPDVSAADLAADDSAADGLGIDGRAPGGGSGRGVRIGVHHFGAPERAERLAEVISESVGEVLAEPLIVVEMGLVAAAHLGPGSLGVIVAPA